MGIHKAYFVSVIFFFLFWVLSKWFVHFIVIYEPAHLRVACFYVFAKRQFWKEVSKETLYREYPEKKKKSECQELK